MSIIGNPLMQVINPHNENKYVKFSSPNAFTLTHSTTTYWDGTLQYSTDALSWQTYSGGNIVAASFGGDYTVYLRGTGNQRISANSDDSANSSFYLASGSDVTIDGNIAALLDWQTVVAGGTPTAGNYAFAYLFDSSSASTSFTYADKLILPWASLSTGIFRSMFNGCANLVTPPKLIATTLANYCYRGMFMNCSALNFLPSLPALGLVRSCYVDMFNGCSNIMLSETQTGSYVHEFRVPTTGTSTISGTALTDMFANTGGTKTGGISRDTTYYAVNEVILYN